MKFGVSIGALLLLTLALCPAPAARAGDVGDLVRSSYDAGLKLFAKGDRASLERAFQTLDTRKDEALDSIDYWTLYARVWLALDKDAETLWATVVAERQAAHPASTVFDLARARTEKDPEKKHAAIDAALKRDKKSVPARVAKAVLWLAEEEEDDADLLLDEILEDAPTDEGALLAKAGLLLSDGLPSEAIEYCRRGLEATASGSLQHLMARCYQRLARNDPPALEKALAAAAEALGIDPSPEHITTFDELLKQTGDAATAAKALKPHFERTRHPLLGKLLAESAFRAGDYEGAALGLAAADDDDLAVVKGLAVSHARLGHAAEMRVVLRRVVAMDSHGPLFAAALDLQVGDAAAALKRLGALSDPDARRLRARAHAWAGQPDAVKKLAAKQMASGSREGEALLIVWLQAKVLKRMDAGMADAVRKRLLKARLAAGSKPLAQGEGGGADLGKSTTEGWPQRALTFFRAPCGLFYRAAGDGGMTWIVGDKPTISQSAAGEIESGGKKFRGSFSYNARAIQDKDGGFSVFTNPEKLGDFKPAEAAFAKACAAYVAGDLPAAEASFAKALQAEPNWSRIKVLRAVMRALAPKAEKREEARDARKAVEPWTDDFDLRRLVICLRAWAGDAELLEEVDALAKREAQYNVRDVEAL